jgi:hypothetical protein
MIQTFQFIIQTLQLIIQTLQLIEQNSNFFQDMRTRGDDDLSEEDEKQS